MKSYVLLGIQLLVISWLLATRTWRLAPAWAGVELFGVAIVVWAIGTMKPHRVNPLPEVRHDAQLITGGPYRFVRHPIYSGGLIAMLAFVLNAPTIFGGIAWLILLVNLLIKLNYEETLLTQRFPDYVTYRQRTWKLLPFVY